VTSDPGSGAQLEVVIAGGGVAALEAALALRDMAGDRIALRLVTPSSEFVYRPMTVREPLAFARAERFPIREIADHAQAELLHDKLVAVDVPAGEVHNESGATLRFDALLLGLGARPRARYEHAITLDDQRLDEQLHGLIQDLEDGYLKRLALVIPPRMGWPMPIYDLAMLISKRAYDMNVDTAIALLTPEAAPLQIFGDQASEGVTQLLEERGIELITSAYCEIPGSGHIEISPGDRRMEFDRIIALPELHGMAVPGVPADPDGFIPAGVHRDVTGAERVYAAGDGTDFAVKHGGIAAQQADVAASAIAALAGADVEPLEFDPVLHAVLLTGDAPRYLSARITGGHGASSRISTEPTWDPPTKIVARYLAPFLERAGSQSVQ
jgi:sulfide:quinone oxidoreductase